MPSITAACKRPSAEKREEAGKDEAVPRRPRGPRTRTTGAPTRHDRETIAWAFGIVDVDGPWGWRSTASRYWWSEILPQLKNLESMTWDVILQAAGGRTAGNNSRFVEIDDLTPRAKARLAEIGQDDVSELFSLRLAARARIYGIRDRRALKLIWYDPFHGTNSRAVVPVKGR